MFAGVHYLLAGFLQVLFHPHCFFLFSCSMVPLPMAVVDVERDCMDLLLHFRSRRNWDNYPLTLQY